jgi:hypothetical protein
MTDTKIKRPVPEAPNALRDWFTNGLRAEIEARGLPVIQGDEPAERGGIALHPIDVDAPKSFRRKNRAVFVVGIGESEGVPEVPLATLYPLQLRSLGNIFVLLIPDGTHGGVEAFVSTLEQGSYSFKYWGDDEAFFHEVADRLTPLATSTLIIENEFVPDLEEELWGGDENTSYLTGA